MIFLQAIKSWPFTKYLSSDSPFPCREGWVPKRQHIDAVVWAGGWGLGQTPNPGNAGGSGLALGNDGAGAEAAAGGGVVGCPVLAP